MELPVTRSARAIALTTTMIALFALAGCSSGPKPTLYCPDVSVLQEANHVIRGRGKQDDFATRVVDARITGIAGKCTKSGKADVTVAFQIGFSARRGPALTRNSITLPYFIATVQGNQIFDKQVYPVTFDFKGGADETTATTKAIRVVAPNIPRSAQQQILVGFQLNQAELARALRETP